MRVEAELGGLLAQLLLGGARAGHDEAHAVHALDQAGQRLERELEALLVDQPAHQQHELLVRLGEAAAQRVEVVHRHELGGVDPVRDHGHARLLEPVDVGHVLAHVGRAGDHPLRAVGHPALDAVDVGLRVLVHPALVAAVLGGVDRDHERRAEALGQVVAGAGHEPVVAVHHVEVVAVAHLHPGGQHVRVHVLDPGHELAEVARALGLADAVDQHAAGLLLGRVLLAPARDHVHVDVLGRQVLGQLAHVARQPALDQRGVLPGQDEGAHQGVVREARSRSGARLRSAGGGVFQTAERSVEVRGVRRRAPIGVVAGQRARAHEGPIARLQGQQLARRRRARPGRRPAATVRSSARRAAKASSATWGESQVEKSLRAPQVEASRSRRSAPTRSMPSLSVTSSRPARGASSSTARSHCCPSYHQWPSSSVSSAQQSSPPAAEARGRALDEVARVRRAPARARGRGRRAGRRCPRA